jgi:hypothetical protein
LVKADWKRTFIGKIIKEKTGDGKDIIGGNVMINADKI